MAFEALARGPVGSPLERPDLLFGAARRHGKVVELDWVCRAAALRDAASLDTWVTPLFINVEPEALDTTPPGKFATLWEHASGHLNIVLELTERALAARPAALLKAVARVREFGWRIALDDVGAHPDSLALMPLLQPDVIKLDLRLVQDQPNRQIAAIVNAVNHEVERSGATLLAEGIETAAHADTALSMGAVLGQGWFFGRPEALPTTSKRPTSVLRLPDPKPQSNSSSPFRFATQTRPVRQASKALLIEMSKHLEQQALDQGPATIVLATFQHWRFFTTDTQRRYRQLVESAAFVGVFGEDMPPAPLPDVRGAHLEPDDPLLSEWDIAILSPHFSAALVARDVGDNGPERDRCFDFALTYDRNIVVTIAQSLMARIAAVGEARASEL